MLVHYPLNLLRTITFPKHSKGLVSRKSRAISPPKCICHIQKGYTSQMSNRTLIIIRHFLGLGTSSMNIFRVITVIKHTTDTRLL